MWVAENVTGLDLPNNDLDQKYGIRSSHAFEYVSFWDDMDRADREADAMNSLNIQEPSLEETMDRQQQFESCKQNETRYEFIVKFTRYIDEDAECGGEAIEDASLGLTESLKMQFINELQECYDQGLLAGRFAVIAGPSLTLTASKADGGK